MSRRPMTPVETASAGILAGLAVATQVVSTAAFGSPGFLAAVPLALLAHQHRTRVAAAATVTVCALAAVTGGLPSVRSALLVAGIGVVVGLLRRRRLGWGPAVVGAVVLGLTSAAVGVTVLLVLGETRQLLLQGLGSALTGSVDLVRRVVPWLCPPGLEGAVDALVRWVAEYWWLVLGLAHLVRTAVATLLTYAVLGVVLRRLRLDVVSDPLVAALDDERPPAPLPLRLRDVGFRYPGTDHEALCEVRLTVHPGETIALVGPNGSGKSTLAHVLAGAAPTSGTVDRPGGAGLGRPGGTALLAQRSELQLLGETLADDVRWGVPDTEDVDVAGLLDLVGLAGREAESPENLSGGELQRLALAGALARRPAFLVSDESTAMVDPAGRARLVAVLRSLPKRLGTTVVHVTHDPAEAAGMDRLVRVEGGRVVADGPTDTAAARPLRAAAPGTLPTPGGVVLTLSGVGHTYAPGTPWEARALHGIDLELRSGEGVLITGTNGSGKSTLARIMAGLLAPTEGWCESIPHRPMRMTVGRVALAMQFPRLQLRRPSVGEDLLDAVDEPVRRLPLEPAAVDTAVRMLRTVGLPASILGRSVDELSGGQMRRVALAGLLGTRPRVLVLDEPFAGLDDESRGALARTLEAELWRGLALVVITHDVHGLEALCSRRLVLDKGRLA